VITSSLDSAF